MEKMYWADKVAKMVSERKKNTFIVAAGITPSGFVHIGNFREVITVDIVYRALKDMNKRVRFLYFWDDYDRLRKIPANIPRKEEIRKFMYMPIVDVPDPFECHRSYAEHFESEFENSLKDVNIRPEFIKQSNEYKKCVYAEYIKNALEKRMVIMSILNKYRKEKLKNYWPVSIYCENCKREKTRIIEWDDAYMLRYICECKYEGCVDIRKNGNIKLKWRIDWPMRWSYYGIDFEPGGKEHSTPGGSYDTAKEIVKNVYGSDAPVYLMYDFIIVKGSGGKMSSSSGNIVKLSDTLKVYLPEIVRFLFASTKPKKEFSIALDDEIFKVYEDFYTVERIYFGKEDSKRIEHIKRIYEMSVINISQTFNVQPSFRHCVNLINVYGNVYKALKFVKNIEDLKENDEIRYKQVLERAKNWIKMYADKKYVFNLRKNFEKINIDEKEKKALKFIIDNMKNLENEEDVAKIVFESCKYAAIKPNKLFKTIYRILIDKDNGPKLSRFVMVIGKKKFIEMLKRSINKYECTCN